MTRITTILFALSLGGLLAAQAAPQAAPPAPPAGVAAEAKTAYTGIKNNLTKMADKMSEENYAFKATPEIRTFGALMAHIADAQTMYCSMAAGEMKRNDSSAKTSKADIVAALKASFDTCDAVFDKLTDASAAEGVRAGRGGQRTRLSVLWGMIAHSNEEYGYGSIYLRLKGVIPPSSEPRN